MSPWARWATVVFCAIGVLLDAGIACKFFLPGAWQGRNDFLGFYAGAQLAGSPGLYDRDAVKQVHLRATGETFEIEFPRLPYYAWMLKPLGSLSYRSAYMIWEILLASAFAGFLALWPGAATRIKWCLGCWSLPAFVCLFNGQDDLLVLWWAALAAWLLRAGRPASAGMALTLCASKYHLLLLAPLVIVAQRRWRMLAGAAIGGSLLLALSFAAGGKDWMGRYYAVVTRPAINASLAHMPNLHSLVGAGRFGLAVQMIVAAALAAGIWLAARRSTSFEEPLAWALIAGVLIGFHGYLHDCSLLLPGMMMAFRGAQAKSLQALALALASVVPWFMLQLPSPLPVVTKLLILTFAGAGILACWRPQIPSLGNAKLRRAVIPLDTGYPG